MHENETRAVRGDQSCKTGVFFAATDIVDNVGASLQGRGGDWTQRGVHAYWNGAVLTKRANDGLNTLNLLRGRNARGAGARAFATNVKHVGALLDHALAMRNGLIGCCKLTAIRKRIRRAIENARKQGPRRERQRRVVGYFPMWQRCSVNVRHGFFVAGIFSSACCRAPLSVGLFEDFESTSLVAAPSASSS